MFLSLFSFFLSVIIYYSLFSYVKNEKRFCKNNSGEANPCRAALHLPTKHRRRTPVSFVKTSVFFLVMMFCVVCDSMCLLWIRSDVSEND